MARSAPGPATGWPLASTSPEVWYSSPPMMRSSVDLPQPEAPTKVTNSLSAMSRLTSFRASTRWLPSPNTLPTCWMEIFGMLMI